MSADRTPLQELWARMLAMYGFRFESAYGRTPEGLAGQTWAAGLADLTPAQIGRGLSACLTSGDDWPPPLPLFRARCLGIPSLAATRLDITRDSDERHPFTRLVWSLLDPFAHRRANAEQGDRMVRDAYELARERVMAGEKLPEPSRKLEAPEPAPPGPRDPVVARRYMDDIAAALGVPDRRTAAAGPDA